MKKDLELLRKHVERIINEYDMSDLVADELASLHDTIQEMIAELELEESNPD